MRVEDIIKCHHHWGGSASHNSDAAKGGPGQLAPTPLPHRHGRGTSFGRYLAT